MSMVERVRAVLPQLPEEFVTADVRALVGGSPDSSTVSVALHDLCEHGEVKLTGRTQLRGKRHRAVYRRVSVEAAGIAADNAQRRADSIEHLQNLALAWGSQRVKRRDDEHAGE